MRNFINIDPKDISVPERYALLLACVAPRPIAFVSTLSKDGVQNLAPFSYFMAGGANPVSVAISPTTDRNGNKKHTLTNIEETGEYTINIVTYDMRDPMNMTSTAYPQGVSEWDDSGLTPRKSSIVQPPLVAESPLSMEVKLFQVVSHGDLPVGANYVIGEVVQFHVDLNLLVNGVVDPERVDYIARMSGDWYSRANPTSMFTLDRPNSVKVS